MPRHRRRKLALPPKTRDGQDRKVVDERIKSQMLNSKPHFRVVTEHPQERIPYWKPRSERPGGKDDPNRLRRVRIHHDHTGAGTPDRVFTKPSGGTVRKRRRLKNQMAKISRRRNR